MTLRPEDQLLVEQAALSAEDRRELKVEYVELEGRLRRDGFGEATVDDVLRSLIYARTSPVDLAEAVRALVRHTTEADRSAFEAHGPDAPSEVRRSLELIIKDRFVRSGDARLRRWFGQRGIRSREQIAQAVLQAFDRHLRGQPLDVEQLLGAALDAPAGAGAP